MKDLHDTRLRLELQLPALVRVSSEEDLLSTDMSRAGSFEDLSATPAPRDSDEVEVFSYPGKDFLYCMVLIQGINYLGKYSILYEEHQLKNIINKSASIAVPYMYSVVLCNPCIDSPCSPAVEEGIILI